MESGDDSITDRSDIIENVSYQLIILKKKKDCIMFYKII